eukprot:1872858-Pyramimonas_sp.AAC.1
MQPVAKLVMWMPRVSQASHSVSTPATFVRIVSSLWLSHQSTFGRPVIQQHRRITRQLMA